MVLETQSSRSVNHIASLLRLLLYPHMVKRLQGQRKGKDCVSSYNEERMSRKAEFCKGLNCVHEGGSAMI